MIKELELQLNYVCYDKNMIEKLNKVWEVFYLLEAEAEAEIARIKKELAEECLDLICGWCNGEGVTIEAGEEGQAIQVQCQYCHASGVDYNKINMLKAKYGTGGK